MKVLATDPGYDRLGIAVLEDNHLLFSNCVTTDREDTFDDRLHVVISEFSRIIEEYSPDCVAIEKLFFNTNQKTAMHVAEVRGALIAASKTAGLSVFEYTPGEIKVAITGYGKSDKAQVTAMVKRLVHIEKDIKYDDEYDAIAVALTCAASERNYPQVST